MESGVGLAPKAARALSHALFPDAEPQCRTGTHLVPPAPQVERTASVPCRSDLGAAASFPGDVLAGQPLTPQPDDVLGHRITGDPQQGKSRGAGWEFVHVCINDASHIAFSQILPDETKESAIAFLKAAVAYYASLGVAIARVMTDNAPATDRRPSPGPAASSASSMSGQGPTRQRPTARPSASSRPRSGNGHMLSPRRHPISPDH